MPPDTASRPLPNYSGGPLVLEARQVQGALSTDLVLYWSTHLDAGDFIYKCSDLHHAPGFLDRIEVIADGEFVSASSPEALRDLLHNRKLVRFNVADWSVIWIGSTNSGIAELQAIFGTLPGVMRKMIKESVYGYSHERVDEFVGELNASERR